jgi:glycosyltransferase involved in cell wall biosynthesis
LQLQGIECIEIPDLQRAIHPQKDMRAFQQIKAALQRVKPDIVACHSSKAGLLGRLAAKACGVPVTFTAHGWAFTVGVSRVSRVVYWALEKFAAYFTDHIITVSQFDRNLALRAHITHPRRITAIHNGMPMQDCPVRQIRSSAPLNLLMVARIGAQKDHARLLRALWGCVDMPWVLNLVGGGDDLALRQMVEHMGMSDRVNFLGEREDVPDLMVQADLFLLISNWEGLPLSILEAMRAGLPVIASHVGGVSEAVLDRKTGWLVRAGDDASLLDALQNVLPDRLRLLEMGAAGRERFVEKFTFSTMAQKTLAVYETVLAPETR